MPEFDSTVEYRSVSGFPDYAVGNDGSFWTSLKHGPGRYKGPWKRMRPGRDTDGYEQVSICPPTGKRTTRKVHALVLAAFKGPRPDGMQTRHLNGKKDDNRLENLAYGTSHDNHQDQKRHGTDSVGDRNPRAKLTEDDIRTIRHLKKNGMRARQIAVRFPVTHGVISKILRGALWAHVN